MEGTDVTLIAMCGINCGECPCYLAKDNDKLMGYLLTRGIKQERLPCPGCRSSKGNCPVIGDICETYTCAMERDVSFCFECAEFPCIKLNPAADQAGTLPHNTKVYNLCYIQKQGLAKFLDNSAEIKRRYYEGKMSVGKGPQLTTGDKN